MLKRTFTHPKILVMVFFVFASFLFVAARIFLDVSMSSRVFDAVVFIFFALWGVVLVREMGHEIEARREVEKVAQELTRANEQLRMLDRQRSEFISIVSHQLRTPLTAIKGYSAMMLEGSFGRIPHSALSAIDRVFQSSEHLVHIVDDLLNVSRIEQGDMHYDFEAVDLSNIGRDVAVELSPIARAKKVTLSFVDSGDDTPYVKADLNKIRQVISNLVDNAIDYTTEGGVEITVTKGHKKGTVILSVSDTGIGMNKKVMGNLFKKFFRGEEGSKANTGGSGLGLYVAQQMVRAHKGHIWAESAGLGKGSTFYVELNTV